MIPKFRAWDKKDKAIRDVTQIIYMYKSVVLNVERTFYERTFCEIELMQSTGLKDKNGVEIYEGDIIKNSYDEIYTVKWFDASFYLEEKYNGGFDYHELHLEDNKKVIGNIYENPELLEDN